MHLPRGILAAARGTRSLSSGAPEQRIHVGPYVETAALLGVDHPNLRPLLAVAEGDAVRAGQVLFRDRARPDIAFVSPISGKVATIELGPRRTLSALILRKDPDETAADSLDARADDGDGDSVRIALLERGLWPALLTRPFGSIAEPGKRPEAIFVTATDSEPLAPDPRVVLAGRLGTFQRGVEALAMLTSGTVHVCQAPGEDLVGSPASARIRTASFAGPHPSGLAGTHVHRLHSVAKGGEVWTVGYQDVVAIGHLFETGRYLAERVVALSGPRVVQPRLVRSVLGASTQDLTDGEIREARGGRRARILSGSVLSGRDAAYLGRYHRQVCVIDAPSAVRGLPLIDHLDRRRNVLRLRPLVPTASLERALPPALLPVPLMRALSVGDSEAAQRLGCLDLVEEDMALLTSRCTSRADYAVLLRSVLDDLAKAA